MKLWILRIIAVVGMLMVIAMGVMDYLENQTLQNLPKMALALLALILMLVRTFVGQINTPQKREMKDALEKHAAPFRDEPRAKKLFCRGLRGVYGGDNDVAYTYLTRAYETAQNPRAKARAAFYMGSCALSEKNYTRALDYLENAVRLDPGYPSAWSNLYTVHMAMNQPEKARAACENGLLYSPQNTPLLSRLGKYYYDISEFEKARDMYMSVWKQEPANPVSCANLALACAGTGDFSAAEEYLSKAEHLGYPKTQNLRQQINAMRARRPRKFTPPAQFLLETESRAVSGCTPDDVAQAVHALLRRECDFIVLTPPERGSRVRFMQSALLEEDAELQIGVEDDSGSCRLYSANVTPDLLPEAFLQFYTTGRVPASFAEQAAPVQ